MANSELIFDGTGKMASDAFIRAIRRHLLADPKRGDDDAYAARVAATCLGGKALVWFINQPDDIQGSWKAMQLAILARWPSSGGGSNLISKPMDSSIPTPAAAPSGRAVQAAAPSTPAAASQSLSSIRKRQPKGKSASSSRISIPGKILIVPKDRSPQGYLGATVNKRGHYVITRPASNALVVELSGSSGRGSEMMLLGKTASVGLATSPSSDKSLAERLMGRRSIFWASMATISAGSEQSSSTVFNGPTQTKLWDVSDSGALGLAWEAKPGVWCNLVPILRFESGSLGVTNDVGAYEEKLGRLVTPVDLFFEPI